VLVNSPTTTDPTARTTTSTYESSWRIGVSTR